MSELGLLVNELNKDITSQLVNIISLNITCFKPADNN